MTLLSLQSLQVGRRLKQVPLVLAASFLAFIDLFRLGRVYTSRCFGYTIVDLFSLVKLPVVFDLVRTTVLGVCRYLFFLCFLLCSLREQGTHNLVYKFVLVDSLRVCGGLVGNGEKVCIKDGEDCGVKNHKSRKVKWPSSGSVGCVCRLDRASVRAEDTSSTQESTNQGKFQAVRDLLIPASIIPSEVCEEWVGGVYLLEVRTANPRARARRDCDARVRADACDIIGDHSIEECHHPIHQSPNSNHQS